MLVLVLVVTMTTARGGRGRGADRLGRRRRESDEPRGDGKGGGRLTARCRAPPGVKGWLSRLGCRQRFLGAGQEAAFFFWIWCGPAGRGSCSSKVTRVKRSWGKMSGSATGFVGPPCSEGRTGWMAKGKANGGWRRMGEEGFEGEKIELKKMRRRWQPWEQGMRASVCRPTGQLIKEVRRNEAKDEKVSSTARGDLERSHGWASKGGRARSSCVTSRYLDVSPGRHVP